MPLMGKSFDHWYVIGASENPCTFHIVLVRPFVSIHVLTSYDSLFQSPISIVCSPWCIHFEISVLRSIKNWVLGSFWIFMIVRDYNCWLYAPPALELATGDYAVRILVLTLFFPHSSIHDHQIRFLNSWPVAITLHDTSSSTMISVPPLWNGPSEILTLLYPVLILLVLNHLSVLLDILSFMGILPKLLFTSSSLMIAIPSLIMVSFKISYFCWLGWSNAFPTPPMFWNMIVILPSLFSPLSWWPQSPWRFLLVFVSVMFGISIWRCPGGWG